MTDYQSILRAFHETELQYLIVGGVAVNLHGYPRFTGDIDILLALNHKNLGKMATIMQKMGYEQRLPLSLEEFDDEQRVRRWMEEKGLVAYTFINPSEPEFSVDVIVGASLAFQQYDDRKVTIEVWHMKVPVISIDDLIAMKEHSDRKKDAEDVAALLELKGL